MTPGPVTILLGKPADTTAQWSDLDIGAIVAQLKSTGVFAPADQTPELQQVVARADAQGHDLYVVVLQESYSPFTVYRDIATELQSQVGGTVLVMGPGSIGTASSDFSRVQLEDGTSEVKAGTDTVVAVNQIYDRVTEPHLDWTLATIALIVVVVIGAVLARLMQLRRRRSAVQTAGGEDERDRQTAPGHTDDDLAGSSTD